jgi:uncharacterized protein (TIGR02466 family)
MTEKTVFAKGELISLFSTPVVVTNIGRDFTETELQLFLEDIPYHKDADALTTGEKGMSNHQSKDRFLFDSHSDTLKDIKKFCEHQLKNYLEHIEGVDTNLAGLRITQSWLNKTKPGESHHSHFHRNSYLSAVFYISCLPKDYINIEKSHRSYDNMIFPIKKTTEWNVSGLSVRVTEGDLIIFPSWVRHNVSLNKTKNRERISLAFNTFPIGEMGTHENVDHLIL